MMRMRIVLVALSLVCHLSVCHAFVSLKRQTNGGSRAAQLSIAIQTGSTSTASTTTLYGTIGDPNSDEEEDGDIDVEWERQRLESLLGTTGGSSGSPTNDTTAATTRPDLLSSALPMEEWKKQIRNPPLLTSIGRERMEMEITLLESLAESDDAIPELWNLWYNARGPGPAKELMKTEALVAQGQPDGWRQAEEMLRQIIAEEGIHWVEPLNRLATLMFLQSRHEESKELCELVLQLKPWHFGALSGMVMVQQGLQDQEGMLEYARRRMPPLPRKGEEPKQPPPGLEELETRQQWVDRMLDLARARALRQEMDLEESFADLDKKREESATTTDADNIVASSTTNRTTEAAEEPTVTEDKASSPDPTIEEADEEDAWQ